MPGHGRATARGAEQVRTLLGSTRCHRSQRGLRVVAAQAQAHRAGLRLGKDGGAYSSGNSARAQARGPSVRADDDGVQVDAHALAGANPLAVCVRPKKKLEELGNQQKRLETSSHSSPCEKQPSLRERARPPGKYFSSLLGMLKLRPCKATWLLRPCTCRLILDPVGGRHGASLVAA